MGLYPTLAFAPTKLILGPKSTSLRSGTVCCGGEVGETALKASSPSPLPSDTKARDAESRTVGF